MTKKEKELFQKALDDAQQQEYDALQNWERAKENGEKWGFTEQEIRNRESLYHYFEGKATALYLLKISMGLL